MLSFLWLLQHDHQAAERCALPDASTPSTSGRSHLPSPAQTPSNSQSVQSSPGRDPYGYEETWELPDDGYTPFPSNLPTGAGNETTPHHELFKSSRAYFGVHASNDCWRNLSQVCDRLHSMH